jgi:Ca-activated chloride channel family protein
LFNSAKLSVIRGNTLYLGETAMKKTMALSTLSLALAACSFNNTDSVDTAKAPVGETAPAVLQEPVPANMQPQHQPQRRELADKFAVQEQRSGRHVRMPGAPAATAYIAADQQSRPAYQSRERYNGTTDNPIKRVHDAPMSTFSIDVDAASFSLARRFLKEGRMPPADAIRSEEIINALAYEPMAGLSEQNPVGVETRIMATPWNAGSRLLQVRLSAWEPAQEALPDSNYVFLIDVSGSMQGEDRLGLLKRAFSVMLTRLKTGDTVALVTYAAGSKTVLEPTPASDKHKILAALDALTAGGSTHASDGIQRAYRLAQQAFISGGNNRVILATDGDVNVGLQGDDVVKMVEGQRDREIYLTVLGVGRGNYMDAQLEPLADHGDGNYYYLDSFQEARRVLVSGLKGTAYTVAKDVKLQVEFNPAVVAEYRLIGYNNRQLADADFNNDAKDAGDIGAGHSVTALYEITLANGKYRFVDEPRYGVKRPEQTNNAELALVKLRYKHAAGEASVRRDYLVASSILRELQKPSEAVVAAAFAKKLRKSPYLANYGWPYLQSLSANLNASRDNHADLKNMLETAALLEASRG